MPIPIRLLVVSATKRLSVPAAFWIWKAAVESELFCCKTVPVNVEFPLRVVVPLIVLFPV